MGAKEGGVIDGVLDLNSGCALWLAGTWFGVERIADDVGVEVVRGADGKRVGFFCLGATRIFFPAVQGKQKVLRDRLT